VSWWFHQQFACVIFDCAGIFFCTNGKAVNALSISFMAVNNRMSISWNDFEKVDMRAGTVLEVQPFEKAKKPAYKLWIDFGELGVKKSSAQITALYRPEELIGKQVIAVVNFPPKQIADFMSECLVLGVYNQNNDVVLLHPSEAVQNGGKVG
jgi:tRNA-binding protein